MLFASQGRGSTPFRQFGCGDHGDRQCFGRFRASCWNRSRTSRPAARSAAVQPESRRRRREPGLYFSACLPPDDANEHGKAIVGALRLFRRRFPRPMTVPRETGAIPMTTRSRRGRTWPNTVRSPSSSFPAKPRRPTRTRRLGGTRTTTDSRTSTPRARRGTAGTSRSLDASVEGPHCQPLSSGMPESLSDYVVGPVRHDEVSNAITESVPRETSARGGRPG